MSFHPLMVYDSEQFQSRSARASTKGSRSSSRRERRGDPRRHADEVSAGSEASAVLGALYLVQEQEGYLTASGMRHVAGILEMTPAEVEDVATYYVMFFRERVGKSRAAGLPHAFVRAERRRTRDRGAVGETGNQAGRDRASGMFTLIEFECLGACDRAPVVMVNNEHWHEKATPESCAGAGRRHQGSRRRSIRDAHLRVER